MNNLAQHECTSTLGIDIAKDKFDVAHVLTGGRIYQTSFSNDNKGFKELRAWCRRHGESQCLLAVMEATGLYGEPLAEFLSDRHHRVCVENPAKIKYYGKSLMKRNKTDRSDARLIAEYASATPLKQWQPLSPIRRSLRKLITKRTLFIKDMVRMKNCLGTMLGDSDMTEMLNITQQRVNKINQQVIKEVASDEVLKHQAELIVTIKGFGKLSAAVICASVDMSHFRNGRQFAAYIGVSPRRWESGNWQGPTRMCKCGHAQLRAIFYMCAMSAKRYNPGVQAFCKRLEEKGLKNQQIIGAVMNKMARTIFALIRDDKPFAPDTLAGGLHEAF